MHLVKEVTKGLATTKCGLTNQSQFSVTVWYKDVTCPICCPNTWRDVVKLDGGAQVGKKMVRKKAAPRSTSAGDSPTTTKPVAPAAPRRKMVKVRSDDL